MAHKKGQGSTSNGRDSRGQRLGVKRYGGQAVKAGENETWHIKKDKEVPQTVVIVEAKD